MAQKQKGVAGAVIKASSEYMCFFPKSIYVYK